MSYGWKSVGFRVLRMYCSVLLSTSRAWFSTPDWSKIIFTTGEIRVTCPDHKFLLQHWCLCHAFSIRFKYVPAFMCTYNRIFIFFSLLGWMSFMVLKYVGMFLATNPVWYPAMETLLKNLLDWLQICRVTYLVIWENQMLCYRCSFLVLYRL